MASWPSVDATSVFILAFAIAKNSFLLQVFCFVLHRDLLNSYARQTVSYWTGSKVPATGYGIVYRSLHYGKVGSQAKFLGQAQATQQVPCFAVASFHTLAVQKNKTFTSAKAFVRERREKSHQLSENLAFFLRRHPYAIQDSTSGSVPGALPSGVIPSRSRLISLPALNLNLCKFITEHRARDVSLASFLPGRGVIN